jgi:hypothetical protein
LAHVAQRASIDHRRRYAAIESLKIGYGGIAYVAQVLGMSRRTIHTGIRELEHMGEDDPDDPKRPSGDAKRVCRRGGARPPISERNPLLKSVLQALIIVPAARSRGPARDTAPAVSRALRRSAPRGV